MGTRAPAAAPVVIPVSYFVAGRAVESTSSDLGEDSVYVRCLQPPRVGTIVALKLHLPELDNPEVCTAIVRDVVKRGAAAGFRAEFIDLSPAGRQRIAGHLSGEDVDLPRRGLPRYATSMKVKFSTAREFVQEYASNISAGGLFVATDQPPPLDTVVRLELELPDGGPPVSVDAQVVHAAPGGGKRLPGVGVQFIGGEESFRSRIDQYIARLAG